MHVTLLSRYEDLVARAEGWNALARGRPFLRWEWLGTWWRHYGRSGRLFVPAVEDDSGNLLGLAPWWLENRPAQGRVVRFLGSGEVCSDYLTLLTQEGHEAAVADAIADWLHSARAPEHRWDLLELDGCVNDDPAVWRLIERLAGQGNTLHRRDGPHCWRIPLPTTWEEFQGWQSSTHRRQVRRALERAEDSGRSVLRMARTPEEFEQGWNILVDLHQRRRTSLGQAGCFASRRFHDFLYEASRLFLAAGGLRLSWLEYDGQPIAAEQLLTGDDVIFMYQAGVEPERLEAEPGRMIAAVLIKSAITEGFAAWDFLRGDEPYKSQWRAKPRRLVEWRVVPQRPLPQLRHSAWLAGGAMKNWLRGQYSRFSPSKNLSSVTNDERSRSRLPA